MFEQLIRFEDFYDKKVYRTMGVIIVSVHLVWLHSLLTINRFLLAGYLIIFFIVYPIVIVLRMHDIT